jgi:hypothetical protein
VNIIPKRFIRDLAENPAFNFLLGVGIPENPYLPTIDFNDFCDFNDNGPIIWKRLCAFLTEKYKKRASSDEDKNSVNNIFYNSTQADGRTSQPCLSPNPSFHTQN